MLLQSGVDEKVRLLMNTLDHRSKDGLQTDSRPFEDKVSELYTSYMNVATPSHPKGG